MIALSILLGLAVLALTPVISLVYHQRDYIYRPTHANPTPQALNLTAVKSIQLLTSDGQKLILWYTQAKPHMPTILYFHGNGGEISNRTNALRFWQARGYGFALLEYRGYGGSTGQPTEKGIMIDAKTAYDWLRAQGLAPKDILLLGESLGTAVAIQTAAKNPVCAVALMAPFSSMVDVAKLNFPWLPIRFLLLDQFKSLDHIHQITAPLLFIEGRKDMIVKPELTEKLFALAPQPKEIIRRDNEGHELIGDREVWISIDSFFHRHCIPAS